MHHESLEKWQHSHAFGTEARTRGEVRTRWVIGITALMMGVEIAAGLVFGSMALLADGWHMGTHAAALGVTAFAYLYARRHASDQRYSFGTGKVGALGGFASSVGLAVVALLVGGESVLRLTQPVAIRFDEAIAVATIGLLVNVLCAFLLRDESEQHHGHAHGAAQVSEHQLERAHDLEHGEPHHDHNLRAAYLHVLADALTSVLAIAALITGKFFGWAWMDPFMGLVGALVIARWSMGLLRDTSRVLLDAEVGQKRRAAIIAAIEGPSDDQVTDLHLWRVGPRHMAAIVSVVTHEPQEPSHYKRLLSGFEDLVHVTVEVLPCAKSCKRGASS
jgi:cation diffusion facilitator family transporter